jgi:hypothetical protein
MGRLAGVGHDKLLSSLVSVAPSTGTNVEISGEHDDAIVENFLVYPSSALIHSAGADFGSIALSAVFGCFAGRIDGLNRSRID